MKVIFYLKSCNTCARIIKEIGFDSSFTFREIKSQPITEIEIEMIHGLSKNYESIFNKRALLFREKKKNTPCFKESDYRKFILEHYTFLKRPLIIIDKRIFIGNSKKTISEAKRHIHE